MLASVFAFLGFSGWTKYLWIGGAAVLLIGGALWRYQYVVSQWELSLERESVKDQRMARLEDTNAENVRTIATLKAEKALGEKLQASEAATHRIIEKTFAQWKERLSHVPQTCPIGDSDRVLLDGVRDILAKSNPDQGRDR